MLIFFCDIYLRTIKLMGGSGILSPVDSAPSCQENTKTTYGWFFHFFSLVSRDSPWTIHLEIPKKHFLWAGGDARRQVGGVESKN